MKKALAFIPNLLTLLNLSAGCVAIMIAIEGDIAWTYRALWAVVFAAMFDFLDGFAARLLRATSALGKELDSLADVVSFGVAPAMVVMGMMREQGVLGHQWYSYAPLLLAVCSAYRLAKYNVDQRQHHEFRGLPTPACALFFVGLPFAGWFFGIEMPSVEVLLGLVVLFSGLLVCNLPMFSLKFKTFGLGDGNGLRYLFLLAAGAGLALYGLMAISWIIVGYILISAVRAGVLFAK